MGKNKKISDSTYTEEIDIKKIDNFKNHPFRVMDNEDMDELVNSIRENNLIYPVIVRKKENDRYEMISGHRRKRAFELLGLKKIPTKVLNLTDDEATILMVDSNLQRELVLPSEKAYAYKMKFDALKHQGKTSDPVGPKLTIEEIKKGDSATQVKRYMRLTFLNKELLNLVDNSFLGKEPTMGLRPAVELSYLKNEEQNILSEYINYYLITPSHAQAIELRELSQKDLLGKETIHNIMSVEKPNQIQKIKINEDKIRKVLPRNIIIRDMEDFILRAVEYYGRHLKIKDKER